MEVIYSITGIIWPLVSIFGLIVAIIAHQRYRHSSTRLLLIGAIIGVVVGMAYPLAGILYQYTSFQAYSLYDAINLTSLVGSIVGLVGLFAVVNYLAELRTPDDQHLKF